MDIDQFLNSSIMTAEREITADLISNLSDHGFTSLAQEVWDAFSLWDGAIRKLAEVASSPDADDKLVEHLQFLVNLGSNARALASITVLDQAPQLYLQFQRSILMSTVESFNE